MFATCRLDRMFVRLPSPSRHLPTFYKLTTKALLQEGYIDNVGPIPKPKHADRNRCHKKFQIQYYIGTTPAKVAKNKNKKKRNE